MALRKKRIRLWIMTFLGILLLPAGSIPGEEIREEQIKAAFLYNFAKFIEWPTDSFKSESSPLGLYILGTDHWGPYIDVLKEKNVKGRKIVLRRISRPENLEECHILFISASERNNLRSHLALLKNHNILTVSDMERFAHQGGMIGLINIEGKINFEVNIETVYSSRLKFSAQLLKVARIIRNG
ncbi:MAG: YfiR family protein [Thermodesulfobacteriota bacterium]